MGRLSAYDNAARATERPRCPIPVDRLHEFLSTPLPYDDAVLLTWVQHFIRTGVPFRRVDRAGFTQLYCHRVRLKHNSTLIEQWCCSTKERRQA